MAAEPSVGDQREQVDRMSAALAAGGSLADLDLASLCGRDGSPRHLDAWPRLSSWWMSTRLWWCAKGLNRAAHS
jgi:hypothetical protein